MEKCVTTVIDIIDTVDEVKEEQSLVRAKLVDLEDRLRRNNVKYRRIPKSVQTGDLPKYGTKLMCTVLPDT